jgi:hypothetical protein
LDQSIYLANQEQVQWLLPSLSTRIRVEKNNDPKSSVHEPEVLTDLFYPKHVVQRAGESNKSVHRIGSVDSYLGFLFRMFFSSPPFLA